MISLLIHDRVGVKLTAYNGTDYRLSTRNSFRQREYLLVYLKKFIPIVTWIYLIVPHHKAYRFKKM